MSHTLFVTHMGRLIDYRNIKQEDINLQDISHHLCNTNRFGGCLPLHTRYSVASHSLNCFKMAVELFPKEKELWRTALMHDATEAYLGDVVSGLKTCLPEYKELESSLWEMIKQKYNLKDFRIMDEIDKKIVLDEVQALLPNIYDLYLKNHNYIPYNSISIVPDKYPELIKQVFLKTCSEVGIYD